MHLKKKMCIFLAMAMRMRQTQNYSDNAQINVNMCKYSRIYADMRIGKIWRIAIPSENAHILPCLNNLQ